jgi:hypothetical protein
MILELKPEHAKILERAVNIGVSQDEVLDQVFAVLDDQYPERDWMLAERDSIRSQIEEGFAQSERGELIAGEDVARILQERRAARRIA